MTLCYNSQMVITNLQEKENRKLYVPIRPGNRGGWSLFNWESVREMPYRDREMYLGNSAKIGVLDKGGKWRMKDWFLKKEKYSQAELAKIEMAEAMKKDQDRINKALGYVQDHDQQKLTPAEMQELMKKLKMKKEGYQPPSENNVGLGFDKTKVQIRAKPSATMENPHRLQGTNLQFEEKEGKQEKKKQKDRQKEEDRRREKEERKREKKERKEKRKHRHRHRDSRSDSSQSRERSRSRRRKDRKDKKHRYRSSSQE